MVIPSCASGGGVSYNWSYSNWTLRSINNFLVATSINLYYFAFYAYPNIMHLLLWSWKAFLLLMGILAQDLEQKTLKWETLALCPCSALNGMAPTTDLWDTLLCMYEEKFTTSSQREGGRFLEWRRHVSISSSDLFFLSTIPFYFGVYGTECSIWIPFVSQ